LGEVCASGDEAANFSGDRWRYGILPLLSPFNFFLTPDGRAAGDRPEKAAAF